MPNEVHNCSNSWVIQQFGLSYKSGFLSDLEYASPGDGYLEALQADSAEIYFDRSCSSHTKTGRDRDGALYFPACNDDVDLLEFLVKVAARFPTHEVEALKVILEGCGGNASEAIAEIESLCITIFDESMTLCEEDVQDHDEESGCIVKEDMAGQSDQSDANTEDQAAMMRDEEVYDSDQEDDYHAFSGYHQLPRRIRRPLRPKYTRISLTFEATQMAPTSSPTATPQHRQRAASQLAVYPGAISADQVDV